MARQPPTGAEVAAAGHRQPHRRADSQAAALSLLQPAGHPIGPVGAPTCGAVEMVQESRCLRLQNLAQVRSQTGCVWRCGGTSVHEWQLKYAALPQAARAQQAAAAASLASHQHGCGAARDSCRPRVLRALCCSSLRHRCACRPGAARERTFAPPPAVSRAARAGACPAQRRGPRARLPQHR